MSTDLNVDIHNAPSAADVDVSSALSQPLPTEPVSARSEAMSLLDLQKQLDADITRHMAVLTSNGVNMQTPLIDAQGFPLANKDLMVIRTARQRINILRNDSKAVRDRVSKLLELAINGDAMPQPAVRTETKKEEQLKAFARVNSVAETSPAQTAGLQQGDQILRFGSVTAESPKGLAALAAPGVVVDGTSIQLLVQREGGTQAVALTLVPRANWGGRGLLGCHLLPL
ncbi:related to 26S proteasome non-ATPase regulatory subunit 9 [Ustilago trichophora]|uniref:Probable 26S proteasome regulatory subunit p27 n=1 Tax=Ustilago trichophora TaxID=86804 RepID=A0A5C3ECW6_9BASI|nr:related to 26S proteasome non-ATPase regulatory subunit 9 [Ustilago trichophora]